MHGGDTVGGAGSHVEHSEEDESQEDAKEDGGESSGQPCADNKEQKALRAPANMKQRTVVRDAKRKKMSEERK